MELKLVVSLFLVLTPIQVLTTLIGYDCGSNSPNITTFSLNETEQCDIENEEPPVTNVNIQLLQKIEYKQTKVQACRIKSTVHINHCDWREYATTTDVITRYEIISRETCEKLHLLGQFSYEKVEFIDLLPNITNFRSDWIVGILEIDGDCYGSTYKIGKKTFNHAVVSADLEINFWEASLPANRDREELIAPTGTRCKLEDEKCIDTDGTYMFWKYTPRPVCDFEAYSTLFEGLGVRVGNNTEKNPDVYFANSTREIQFGLAKREEISLCGYTIYATEHAKFFITEYAPSQGPPVKKNLELQDVIVTAYFNTKIANLARHMKSQFVSLYQDIVQHRCRLERDIIENSLMHISTKPDIVAMKIMKKRGYMAVRAGEVAHLVQCEPVTCKVRHIEECYQELPVVCGNTSFFLKPQSHIITPIGTSVDCNPILPTMFAIENSWHQFTPQLSSAATPQKLKPLTTPTWKFTDVGDWMNSGIYRGKDLEKLREHILFPAEKPALLEEVARKLSDRTTSRDGEDKLRRLLDIETIEKIAASKLRKIWNGFEKFGVYAAGVMGVITIIHFIKLILDTIIRGYTLKAVFGWGIHLLGAVWGSLTHMLITMAQAQDSQPPEYNLQEVKVTRDLQKQYKPNESFNNARY